MSDYIQIESLRVAPELRDFVETQALPDTGIRQSTPSWRQPPLWAGRDSPYTPEPRRWTVRLSEYQMV